MDTSKKYIEMCEKAKEIQESWRCAEDDCESLKGAWLPRQDQLQEMVNIVFPHYWEGFLNFILPCAESNADLRYITQFASSEQLWLAFVMKEKHQKVWSEHDKNWIIGKKRFILDEEYFKNQYV